MPRSLLTIPSACAVELAATVTSIRSFSCPEAVTSRPVTDPPDDSTAVVSWLTAVPLAGTSSRTVIEYETLGAVAMTTFFRFLLASVPAADSAPRRGALLRGACSRWCVRFLFVMRIDRCTYRRVSVNGGR